MRGGKKFGEYNVLYLHVLTYIVNISHKLLATRGYPSIRPVS